MMQRESTYVAPWKSETPPSIVMVWHFCCWRYDTALDHQHRSSLDHHKLQSLKHHKNTYNQKHREKPSRHEKNGPLLILSLNFVFLRAVANMQRQLVARKLMANDFSLKDNKTLDSGDFQHSEDCSFFKFLMILTICLL